MRSKRLVLCFLSESPEIVLKISVGHRRKIYHTVKMGNCHIPSCHFWLSNLARKNRKSRGYLGVYWALDWRLSLRDTKWWWLGVRGVGRAVFKAICPNVKSHKSLQSEDGCSKLFSEVRTISRKETEKKQMCQVWCCLSSFRELISPVWPSPTYPPPHAYTSGGPDPPQPQQNRDAAASLGLQWEWKLPVGGGGGVWGGVMAVVVV